MQDQRGRLRQRLAAHLPGWLFFACGLALVGLTVLLPLKADLDQMQWRRDLMRSQANHLGAQETSYGQFHAAVTSDDPILLQRLAYYQLHLKPAGTQPLSPVGRGDGAIVAVNRGASPRGDVGWHDVPTVENLLDRPAPRAGAANQPPQPPNTRLRRLTQGPKRVVLLGIGLVFIYVGMLLPIGGDRSESRRTAKSSKGAKA